MQRPSPDNHDNRHDVTCGTAPPPLPLSSTTLPVADEPARTGGAAASLKRVFLEASRTAATCAAQFPRTVSFLQARRDAQVAQRDALIASEALGQKLEAAEMGEPALRSQLVQLRERIRSGGAAAASARLLAAEQRGLYVRLATPFLESPSAPAGMEPELGQARRLQMRMATARERRASQRLFPEEPVNRIRLAGGFLFVALTVWLGSRWFFAGGPDPGTVATGSRKEIWLDENDNWPRRRAVGLYEGDVPQGEIKFYDGRDRLMATLRYKDGKLHGQSTTFYPGGAKFEEGEFRDGLPTGVQRVWFENGKLARTSETADGEKHGEQICYYDNGQKATVGQNVRGKVEGRMDMFSPDGKHCNILTFANGEQVKDEELIHVAPEQLQLMIERTRFHYELKAHWQ